MLYIDLISAAKNISIKSNDFDTVTDSIRNSFPETKTLVFDENMFLHIMVAGTSDHFFNQNNIVVLEDVTNWSAFGLSYLKFMLQDEDVSETTALVLLYNEGQKYDMQAIWNRVININEKD